MTFHELTRPERLALAALSRAIIRLDRSYSREESKRLHRVAEELGDPEAFWDAFEEVEKTISTEDQLRALAASVTREGARDLVVDVLTSLAVAETMSRAEEEMLAGLQALWGRAPSA